MIRLLLIVILPLFIIYLLTQFFSKDRKEKIRLKFNSKYFLIILIILGIPIILKYFPKIIGKISGFQGLITPFLGIIKNLIPFI